MGSSAVATGRPLTYDTMLLSRSSTASVFSAPYSVLTLRVAVGGTG